jgi:CBS domain-containing protein
MPIYVKDIMVKPVKTINYNKTVRDAAALMKKYGKGSLIVVKNKKPVGIITADDIIHKIVAKNIKPTSIKVKDVMSSPLITITSDSTCVDAAKKMRRNNVKRLPVVDNGKLVGIVSLDDIAVAVPEFTQYLEERLESTKEPLEIKEEITSGICESCGEYSEELKLVNGEWLCESCREDLKSE